MDDINTAVNKPHLTQVDYVRAIASLSVALWHLGGKALPILNYGWLGVQMFFLLSGFIICWSIPRNYNLKLAGVFIAKRLVRIEPPYIISICLVLIANYLLIKDYTADWRNVIFHLAYINSFIGKDYLNPVYWTLGIEFQFYLLVAVFYPVIRHKLGPFALVLVCLPAAFHLSAYVFQVFPLFALGILLFQYRSKLVPLRTAIIVCLLIVICSLFALDFVQTIAGLITLTILMLPLKANKLVSFFSKISFSLYLTHDIVGSRMVVYLGTLWPKTVFYKGIEFATGIIISIAFAYLFYLLVERPCLKASKRITY